ncbi:hypothetical protein LCGC14_1598000 [marine sediment metagenome]|uniref:Uncharacterized protein n=1 Tax=marine sediment metagenome TaxID=412755 RepID=A0A0F9IYG2_9ZZZZ
MSGDIEVAKCDVCGREGSVTRKYYHYNIPCDCCINDHFEFVRHCSDCTPSPPQKITVQIKPID